MKGFSIRKIGNVAATEYVKWICNPRISIFLCMFVFVYDYVAETVTQHAMFACPSNRTCTVRIYNTLSSQFEDYAGFSKTGTESKTIGSLTVTYDIYTNNATSTDKYTDIMV